MCCCIMRRPRIVKTGVFAVDTRVAVVGAGALDVDAPVEDLQESNTDLRGLGIRFLRR